MCLSTVYKNTMDDNQVLMKNVMKVECGHNKITLTDLMERTLTVDGTLKTANLVDGYVIINTQEEN